MICSNCSRTVPDGSKICPLCKAGISTDERRCPSCWAKLDKNIAQCPKCGCDIEKRIREIRDAENRKEPSLMDKIKETPLWIRITVPVFVLIMVLAIVLVSISVKRSAAGRAADMAADYVVSVELAVDDITSLARVYEDMVYGQSWLDHIGSAEAVREVYAQDIKSIKQIREAISYTRGEILSVADGEIAACVNDVYVCYSKCYGYVIGENGKYPTYIEVYNKHLANYDKAIAKLKKVVGKYK